MAIVDERERRRRLATYVRRIRNELLAGAAPEHRAAIETMSMGQLLAMSGQAMERRLAAPGGEAA